MKGDFLYLFGFLFVFAVQGLYVDASNDIITNSDQYDSMANYRNKQGPLSLIEIFHNLMEQAIQLAIQHIERERSNAQRSFDQVYEQIFKIQQNANDVLDEISSDYWKLCAIQEDEVSPTHTEEMKSALSFGRDDISKCIQIAVGEVNNIHNSLVPYIESIHEQIENITAVIDQCTKSSSLIEKEICVLQHVQEVSDSISAIIRDNNESISLASVQIVGVVGENTQGCIQTAINDVKENVEKVVKKIV